MPSTTRFYRSAALLYACGVVLLPAVTAHAQGTRADYDRAAALPALTRGKVFRAVISPQWLAGGKELSYRVDLPDGKSQTWVVDAATGKKSLQTAPARPRSLAPQPPAPGLRSRIGGEQTEVTFSNLSGQVVRIYWIDPDGQRREYGTLPSGETRRQNTYAGHAWLLTDITDKPLAVFVAEERPAFATLVGPILDGRRPNAQRPATRRLPEMRAESPDGKWRAFVQEADVYLRSLQTNEEFRLSENGSTEDAYSERQLFWSPDSRRLVALRTKKGGDRKVTLVESSPRDQLQPRVRTIDYLKPGDPIPQPKPRLFDIPSRREIPVSDELFPTPWSVQGVRWDADSKRFTFLYNQRGHQVLRVISVDAETGAARAIIDEQSPTFIDYAHKQYLRHLDRTGELLWMSERDGWNHLYLYDTRTGAVKNQVTKGEWVVRGVDRVDEEKRQIWFRASGIYPGQDPYYVHYCRINLDGTGLVRLTEGDGTHTVEYSPDGKYLADTYSRVDLPPVTELRSAEDGKLISELERGDWSALLAAGWKAPERFVAKARDGKTDVYGVIFRPTNFDPARKYPVIEDIYAGPQGSFVPKAFQAFHGPQGLAELGFIVVKIDGMGTSNRSKAFHDVAWKNIADAGLPDRILWIQAAARKYPYMDLDRIGIYGTSAGGQNALGALLRHPEFYKVGVSACGCHDNRMDKIWWNELWMGWPLGPHYEEQSNVTQAHRLQGKVLLIVGEMDTNVDPASTMQVVNALVKADKDFDLLVVPGGGHGMGGAYGQRRMHDYFVRHLLGVEPRR